MRCQRRVSQRADDKGDLMYKPCNSQRTDTLKECPLHRDAEHAIDLIRSGGNISCRRSER